MSRPKTPSIEAGPGTESGRVLDIIFGSAPSFGVIVAHQRGLFRLLDGKPMTLGEVCDGLGVQPRAVQALL